MAVADLAEIEAQERAQIISELTYKLDTKQNCSAKLIWDDSGSGADLDGYFFLPDVKNDEYIIGGHASQKRSSKYHCVTTVSISAGNHEGTPPLLVAPVDWQQVWKDSGSGATRDGSFWQAIPPDNNYKCIGSVSQLNHNAKPNLANYRCVHKSLTDKIVTKAIAWSDKGTGAEKQVTIFKLPATGLFKAVPSRAKKVEAYNLKKNATSDPDAKKVEEILAQRMAPLKADIETKSKAAIEQKEAAKKAEAEKIAAEKARQKKLAAAAEKKKQEALAKEKALAAKVETKPEIDEEAEAQKLKEEQQARIAKAMAEKETAEKEKQAQEEQARKEAKPEPEPAPEVAKAEEVTQTEPEISEANETANEGSNVSSNESKGLNDIMMFFLKIFGMMVGGVIIFMIAFKVLFGKKK
jgi:hypothetical protein